MFRRGSWLALLPLTAVVACAVLAPREALLGFLTDDAFYYLAIARSILAGAGSTFDGIASTNGYHPLWMACVVAFCAPFGPEPLGPAIALLSLSALVSALALGLLHGTVERRLAPGMGALALALCLPTNAVSAMTNGMETGLLLLAVFAWVACLLRYELLSYRARSRAPFLSGLLLGTIFLARLDSVFLLLAAGVLFLVSGVLQRVAARELASRSAAQVAGVLVLAVPYFAWSQASFGALGPISGKVKSSFPALRSRLSLDGDLRFGALLVAAGLAITLSVFLLERRRGERAATFLVTPLCILAAASLAHFAYAFLFMEWGVYWWHFILSGTVVILGLPILAARVAALRPRLGPALAIGLPALVALVGIVLQVSVVRHRIASHGEWLAAAEWANERTAPDAVFAMKDAGLFGYFSGRSVVNLDGKANGREYLAALAAGEVHAYLRAAGVAYLADIDGAYQEDRALIPLPRVGQPALRIWTRLEDEVYRGATYERRRVGLERAPPTHFAIWRYSGEVPR